MTTRRWMVAVAALALLIALPAWLVRELDRSLGDLYGPNGQLAREAELSHGVVAALDLVRAGRFAEAEAEFRKLAILDQSNRDRGWPDLDWSGEIRAGLAAAIAGQGRHAEAEPLFRAALGGPESDRDPSGLSAEQLGWYAATLRALGRAEEAAAVEARAAAARRGVPRAAPVTSP